MATNIIFDDGDQLSVTVLAGTASGDPVVFGNQPGVALTDIGDGGNAAGKASVKFSGVVLLELAGAAEEDAVYISTSDYSLSLTDDASSVFYGVCINDADADDMVRVRIGGSCCTASGS
jgi:predicted RecA/RadA family phage recombinase